MVVRYGSPEWRRQRELEKRRQKELERRRQKEREQEAKKRAIEQAKQRYLEQKRQREQERLREEEKLLRRARTGDRFAQLEIRDRIFAKAEERAASDEAGADYHDLAPRLGTFKKVSGWYLRLGDPPESGRSAILAPPFGRVPKEEPGVSVFDGVRLEGGHYVLDVSTLPLRSTAIALFGDDRPAFFVRGWRVGTGADGEPLLDTITEIEPVPPEGIVACCPSSAAIERWNERRGGPLVDRVPGLAAWEDD